MAEVRRVLFFSHLFPRATLPEYGLNAFNAAIRLGTEVMVITRKLPEPLIYSYPTMQILQISYPDSHLQLLKNNKINMGIGIAQSFMGQLLLAIKSMTPARAYHPDVIHSFGALTLPAAFFARLATGAPVVVSLHGTDFHRINRSCFLTWWVGLADAIICVSQDMVVQLQKKLPGKSIHYCPSGVDLKVFQSDHSSQRENIVVCVGRLTFVKRYDLILEAFAKLIRKSPEYRLIILGRGDLLDTLKQQCEQLHISGKVHFGGVVGQDKLSQILRSAKLFLLASDWEGTPKALLEAMACGLPAVTTDVGDCSYLVQGAGRVVTDDSPDSIAQAALAILQADNWEELSAQAIRNSSQFDWQRVTKRIHDVYCSLNSGMSNG